MYGKGEDGGKAEDEIIQFTSVHSLNISLICFNVLIDDTAFKIQIRRTRMTGRKVNRQ